MVRDVRFKTSIEVLRIKKSCRIVEELLNFLKDYIKPGIKTSELDRIAHEFILNKGAKPSLLGYRGFPASICTSVNNVAAHGIPSDLVLDNGDILTVDVTLAVDNWHGDGAWTYLVGDDAENLSDLVNAAWQSTINGILRIRAGDAVGNIGHAIETLAKEKGYSVIKDYVGHGIGRKMHEDPVIPHYGENGTGQLIKPGMVFTVEPILTMGNGQTKTIQDGWTIVTDDNSVTAQFEHTVAVFKDRIEILTFSAHNLKQSLDQPPFF